MEVTAAGEDRRGDVRVYLSDCRALHAHTDWRPQRDARTILEDIGAWATEHRELLDTATA